MYGWLINHGVLMVMFRWKKGWFHAHHDASIMGLVANGRMTLLEACIEIVDQDDRHPTPEQLKELMEGLGYHVKS